LSDIENTSELWQRNFALADEINLIMELYDNAETGFFLSLSDAKKEEIYTELISIANSMLSCYDQLQLMAPTKMNNSVFFVIEENIEILARVKQFLVSKNLYR
jgi:hypothetical protein